MCWHVQDSNANRITTSVRNWSVVSADYLELIKTGYFTVGLRNGIRLRARLKSTDRGAITDIFCGKVYTPAGFDIDEQDLVVDVGANIGVLSLFASRLPKKRKVYAIEDYAPNFELLAYNIENNEPGKILPNN